MKINSIESTGNNLLKTIRGLQQRHTREKSGLFLIEGKKAVAEALLKRIKVKDVLVSQSYLNEQAQLLDLAEVSVVDDKLFKELGTMVSPEGIMAVAQTPQFTFDDLFGKGVPLIVVAHAIQDPGNLGTIMRTALAASATGLVLTKGTVDAFNPKVVRSAMGALFALPIVADIEFEQAVSELKRRSVRVIACQQNAPRMYFESNFRGAVAIVLGNEAQGLTDADLAFADELVSIPMNEQSESLNVAVSGAVVLFSAVQQRLTAKGGDQR